MVSLGRYYKESGFYQKRGFNRMASAKSSSSGYLYALGVGSTCLLSFLKRVIHIKSSVSWS